MAVVPIKCVCGIDIGSNTSQVSLAFVQPDGQKQIFRVWADFQGPNRPNPLSSALDSRDFPADVALDLDHGRLIQGRQAQESVDRFAIKTIISVRAGLRRREILEKMPRGAEFWALCRKNIVTERMIDAVVRENFSSLRDEAIRKVEQSAQSMVINKVIFTYPNYLPEEKHGDFEKWWNYVCSRWMDVWRPQYPNIAIHGASEGQAIGCYITATFQDQADCITRGQLKTKLGVSRRYSLQPVLVVDAGGSSVNVQNVVLKFEESGELECIQSSYVYGAKSGVQGGSELSNCKIRELILQSYTGAEANKAALLADWEYQKHGIDYTKDRAIVVSDSSGGGIRLRPELVREIFHQTQRPLLDAVKREVRILLGFEQRFGVLFCDGSFRNLCLRQEVDHYMHTEVAESAQKNSQTVNYCFLGDCETTWSSAVSAGAAVSLLQLPHPVSLLSRTALGIQRKNLIDDGDDSESEWEPETEATVLLLMKKPQSQEHDNGTYTEGISSVDMDNHTKPRAQYEFVCDPNYAQHLSNLRGQSRSSDRRREGLRRPNARTSGIQRPSIEIPFVNQSIGTDSNLGPYDIGFSVDGLDLPRGEIRWQLDIEDFGFPAHSSVADENLSEDDRIQATLRCWHVDEGDREAYDPLNKEWRLVIETDPASRLLKIAEDILTE
ncbi:hypothetical protein LQW54_002079 [Pestalotiopsis sp. IQ-011]